MSIKKKPIDIAIVGGGIVGCSIAYHIARRVGKDVSIALFEKDSCYKHASTPLSAGGIRMQFSEIENIKMSQYGVEFLKNAHDWLALEKEQDRPDVQFVEGGYLFLASNAGLDTLKENNKTQRTAGAVVDMLYPNDIKSRFPWLNVDDIAAGSLGLKDEGWFDPWSLLASIRKKVVSLGVQIVDGEVTQLVSKNSNQTIDSIKVQEKTSGQPNHFKVGQVINAAGPWAGKLCRSLSITEVPVKPRKRSVFVFHCPDESTWKGPSASPLVVDKSGVYFRREGNQGNFICGVSLPEDNDPDCDSEESLEFPDHELFEEIIWPTIAHRVPSFECIKVGSSWAGFYDYNTFDQNAILGKHPEMNNFYLANGFSGHGLQQAPAAGRAISELLLDGRYTTIDLQRFGIQRVLDGITFKEKNIV